MTTHPDADHPAVDHPAGDHAAVDQHEDDRTLIRSEERLTASTRSVPVRTVRLERYQVTETRTVTVDVVRDRVRMITTIDGGEPQVTDDPVGEQGWDGVDATDAGTLRAGSMVDGTDGSGWLVLTEERVVVTKETVPVERIRLATAVSTVEQVVTDSVRAERVELIDPGAVAQDSTTTI